MKSKFYFWAWNIRDFLRLFVNAQCVFCGRTNHEKVEIATNAAAVFYWNVEQSWILSALLSKSSFRLPPPLHYCHHHGNPPLPLQLWEWCFSPVSCPALRYTQAGAAAESLQPKINLSCLFLPPCALYCNFSCLFLPLYALPCNALNCAQIKLPQFPAGAGAGLREAF